jgi:NTP pyrophosphatase (non-canonical NTP hydrolase)
VDLSALAAQIEQVSQRYAERFAIDRTADWLLLKLQEEVGELTQAYLVRQGQSRHRGGDGDDPDVRLAEELADVICHALLIAHRFDVDVDSAISAKWLSRL